ncbi:MAG: transcription initiation factor IIB 2, partial [Halobacteriales archaeon SW_9_67_25]
MSESPTRQRNAERTRTRERERTEETEEVGVDVCPECGGRLVSDAEHGETVCKECGLVVEEDEI